jgi:hypothetical protein
MSAITSVRSAYFLPMRGMTAIAARGSTGCGVGSFSLAANSGLVVPQWQRIEDEIDAAFNFARAYFVNVMEAQTESGVVARMMSSRSLAKPNRSQTLPGLSQARAK